MFGINQPKALVISECNHIVFTGNIRTGVLISP